MNLTGQNWVVLGASGFIGSNLCIRLVQTGANVVAFGRHFTFADVLTGCRLIEGDYLNATDVSKALEHADFVVHTISTTTPAKSNECPITDVEENLIATLRLIEQCIAKGVKQLIMLSSGGTVYGTNVPIPTTEEVANDPLCSYGIVKLAIEKYLAIYRQQGKLDSVVLRISNPYGPYQLTKGQGVIGATIKRVLNNQSPEIWGDGSVIRDYIYVDDVVDAILASAQLNDKELPRLYNIGSGVGKSLNEVVANITKLHGEIEIKRLKGRMIDIPINILDIQRAKRFLNWYPKTDWKTGLYLTYKWFEKNEKLK